MLRNVLWSSNRPCLSMRSRDGSALLVGKYAITVLTISGEQIEYLIQHDSFEDGACSRSCRFAVNIVSEVLVVNLKPEYASIKLQ